MLFSLKQEASASIGGGTFTDITDEQIIEFLKKLLPDPALYRAERFWIMGEEYRGKFG